MEAALPSDAKVVAVSVLVAPVVPCSANKGLTCLKMTWVSYALTAVSCLESTLKLMMPSSLGLDPLCSCCKLTHSPLALDTARPQVPKAASESRKT
jgi:hypothetical protein